MTEYKGWQRYLNKHRVAVLLKCVAAGERERVSEIPAKSTEG